MLITGLSGLVYLQTVVRHWLPVQQGIPYNILLHKYYLLYPSWDSNPCLWSQEQTLYPQGYPTASVSLKMLHIIWMICLLQDQQVQKTSHQ